MCIFELYIFNLLYDLLSGCPENVAPYLLSWLIKVISPILISFPISGDICEPFGDSL